VRGGGALGSIPVTLVVLTRDEERNLPDCLGSAGGLVGELFVVDSGSTDRTVAIASAHGAAVVHHGFETHARQWRWALDHLPIRHDWVLGLDADQRLTAELAAELRALFARPEALAGVAGFAIPRRQVFRGRTIGHGGYQGRRLLKLFRRDRVSVDPAELVDHHFTVEGPVRRLRHQLVESNRKEDDISFWVDKHNRYARLLAAEGAPGRDAGWRRRLWARLPAYWRPFLYFLYRYLLRLGFLDGREGFVFHFMHAWWFRLLVDVKVEELRAAANREVDRSRPASEECSPVGPN
jgi:glycosyltransferase involved in cell wall biosynthesis